MGTKLKLSNLIENIEEFYKRNSDYNKNNRRPSYLPNLPYEFDTSYLSGYIAKNHNRIDFIKRIVGNFDYYNMLFDYTATEKKNIQKVIDSSDRSKLLEKLFIESNCTKMQCAGCEAEAFELELVKGQYICDDCESIFEDKTGYCSLDCCLGGSCDGSC